MIFTESEFGLTRNFEVVTEFPKDYVIWNIGRINVVLNHYIPLCKLEESHPYHIDKNSLKCLRCKSDAEAQMLLSLASRETVSRIRYEEATNPAFLSKEEMVQGIFDASCLAGTADCHQLEKAFNRFMKLTKEVITMHWKIVMDGSVSPAYSIALASGIQFTNK